MSVGGAYERWGKRALDAAGALCGLVFLCPLLLLVAAAIKLFDRGPVLFKQTRAGRGFAPFEIYKFRSMRVGSRGAQITSDGDARITALGRLLRKSKIDELPQLFNVLRGDMSLVGPRPTVPKYAEMFRAEYEVILSVRPGITDWASIRFRDEEGVLRDYQEPEEGYMDEVLPEKMALYRRYVGDVSLGEDLRILAATALRLAGDKALAPSSSPRAEPRVTIRPMSSRDSRLRRLEPDELLPRRALPLDAEAIGRLLAGRVVLVTGAGGVIGGELSRQALLYGPRKLVLLENHATALFHMENELREKAGGATVVGALGDVRDQSLLDRVFEDERPQIVFHAAAHKHVYQLETNIHEGVSNNLLATYHLARAADRSGVETFILLSTDKADRPASLMAATKRAAEIVVAGLARTSGTRFATVRFGSVLGGAGAVLSLFQEQLEKGRPLTLTHPDAARYFMTAEEAAGLILQAAALAEGGETFTLKPGERIRVLDLARRLVRLSGLDPDADVSIRFAGNAPAEDLEDEAGDAPGPGQRPSAHPGILVSREDSASVESLAERVLSLEVLSCTAGKDAMLRALAALVPAFTPSGPERGFRIHPKEGSIDASNN